MSCLVSCMIVPCCISLNIQEFTVWSIRVSGSQLWNDCVKEMGNPRTKQTQTIQFITEGGSGGGREGEGEEERESTAHVVLGYTGQYIMQTWWHPRPTSRSCFVHQQVRNNSIVQHCWSLAVAGSGKGPLSFAHNAKRASKGSTASKNHELVKGQRGCVCSVLHFDIGFRPCSCSYYDL